MRKIRLQNSREVSATMILHIETYLGGVKFGKATQDTAYRDKDELVAMISRWLPHVPIHVLPPKCKEIGGGIMLPSVMNVLDLICNDTINEGDDACASHLIVIYFSDNMICSETELENSPVASVDWNAHARNFDY